MNSYQNQNIAHMLTLIKENPYLKCIPLVDSDIVASDDHAWWVADWGKARIDEYWSDDERIYIKSKDFDRIIEDKCDLLFDSPEYVGLSDDELEKKIQELVEGYDWQKAIFIQIVGP